MIPGLYLCVSIRAVDNVTTDQSRLIAWTELHASVVCLGVFLLLVGLPQCVLSVLGAISFLRLIWQFRFKWSARRHFGWANAVTLTRLSGMLVLFCLSDPSVTFVVVVAVALLAMDGLDGFLARKFGLVSEFGEYFDKEVDAFFMLLLALMLYTSQRMELWILLPGVLRYGFVFFLKFAKPPAVQEQRTSSGTWIYILMMVALIFCFAPYPSINLSLVVGMTLVLCGSFADAVWRLYHSQRRDVRH